MMLCLYHNPVFRSAINLSTVSIVEKKNCYVCCSEEQTKKKDKIIEQLKAELKTANEALAEYRSSLSMRH